VSRVLAAALAPGAPGRGRPAHAPEGTSPG